MNPSFVYSFDRETWAEEFPSRTAAAAEGIRRALQHPDAPGTVYVGQKIIPSPRAYGHGRQVIDAMIRRVRDDNGDIADDFLRGVTEQQVNDLDNAMQQTIEAWLDRNDLSPRFYRVEGISEHPVPIASFQVQSSSDEVKDLGESEYPVWS